MNYENLYMVKGDTFRFTIEIEGLETDLTSAYFSCKKNREDENYIFQKSLGSGISKIEDTETGKVYEIIANPEDTEQVEDGNYFYDLQLEAEGEVFTPLLGVLRIDWDITKPVNVSV